MDWNRRWCWGGGGGGDLLCRLTLVLGFLLPACRTRLYTNHWAVRITGGLPEANRIASKYGYVNIGQIGTLKDYYHFYHSKTIKRSVLSSRGTHSFISMEPKVEWIQQQVVKRRIKRDYQHGGTQSTYFNDPKWPSMWYMHCSDNTNHCQSDMNIVGAWKRGYTGKNVVVTILDDGIERNHPDLMQNYDSQASFDVNGNDFDPMPRYDASNENKCSGASPCSSVVWISPWQMVGLCFHPWDSRFQVYWTPLQVKANCGLHSAAKGIEKNALAISIVAYHLAAFDSSSY